MAQTETVIVISPFDAVVLCTRDNYILSDFMIDSWANDILVSKENWQSDSRTVAAALPPSMCCMYSERESGQTTLP